MKRFLGGTPIVLIAILTFVSFGQVSIAESQEKTEIVIGASLPLSGGLAAHGRDLKWAYELAVSDVNSNGGIFVKELGKKLPVKLITADNGTNTMKSAALVEKLINFDKVDMLLGGAEPMSVMAACMVAEKYKTYCHTSFLLDYLWKEKNFQWSTDFFVSTAALVASPFELLKAMDSSQRPKKTALVMEDTFAGKGLSKAIRNTGKGYGIEPVLDISLPVNSSDYSKEVAKAREEGVDSMLIFCSLEDLETFLRQLKKDNLSIPFIFTWKGGWSGKVWKDLGQDAQYIVTDGFWSMDYPFNGARELGEKYREKFGEYSITVGLSYGLTQVLFESIEKAGSIDGAKVRAAVLSNQFETVMGPAKYAKNGLASLTPVAAQWWDGKQMLVYPSDHAIWKVKLAPPWNQR